MTFGGVTGSDYSDDYYRILSQYNSLQEYEEAIKKEGRFELYPNADYTALENYYLSQRLSDIEPWEWPSDEKRWEYRSIRKGSRQAYRRAMYSVAAGVANRIVSSHPWPQENPDPATLGIRARLCDLRLGIQPVLGGIKHLNRYTILFQQVTQVFRLFN